MGQPFNRQRFIGLPTVEITLGSDGAFENGIVGELRRPGGLQPPRRLLPVRRGTTRAPSSLGAPGA